MPRRCLPRQRSRRTARRTHRRGSVPVRSPCAGANVQRVQGTAPREWPRSSQNRGCWLLLYRCQRRGAARLDAAPEHPVKVGQRWLGGLLCHLWTRLVSHSRARLGSSRRRCRHRAFSCSLALEKCYASAFVSSVTSAKNGSEPDSPPFLRDAALRGPGLRDHVQGSASGPEEALQAGR